MSSKRRGLGKGIGSLVTPQGQVERPVDVFFPDYRHTPAASLVAGRQLVELDPQKISPNPQQPRQHFDDQELEELVASIREVGVLQPIVVRPVDDDAADYELIMGERRWRAAQKAGLKSIPAIVRECDSRELLRDALFENIHRSQLSPIEEAHAYRELLDSFQISHEVLAEKLGKSRTTVTNTLRLLQLPPAAQKLVLTGQLSAGHARALLAAKTASTMEELGRRAAAEDLSVRQVEELVRESLSAAPSPADSSPDSAKGGGRIVAGKVRQRLDEIAGRLKKRLDTKVKIGINSRHGSITISFATVQDLNRILAELGEEPFQ